MSIVLTKSKYRNTKSLYKGFLYDSKAEVRKAMLLDNDLREKKIKAWRPQVSCPLIVNGEIIAKYIVDFEVTHHNGKTEYIEIKGCKTAAWQIKRKLFAALIGKQNGIIFTVEKA